MTAGGDAKAKVARLAAEGHAKAARAERRRSGAGRRLAAGNGPDARVRERLLARGSFDRVALAATLVGVVGLTALGVRAMPALGFDGAPVLGGAALVGVLPIVLGVRWARGLGIVARERARVAALGFPLEGWLELLGEEARDGRLRVSLVVDPRALEAPSVAEACARLGLVREPGSGATLLGPRVLARATPGQPPTFTAQVSLAERVLVEVIAPLAGANELRRAHVAFVPEGSPEEPS